MRKVWITVGASVLLLSACLDSAPRDQRSAEAIEPAKPIENSPNLPAGKYDIQNARYDDATGQYQVFLLGLPPGTKPLFQHTDVQLARLSDEQVQAGQKSFMEVGESGAPVMYLTPDFQLAYVHNVTEERINPVTQQPETIIVQQQTSSWSPFMSAMAGAMIGNMLFAPRYYYPPPYAAGGMMGYGGMGETRQLASQGYAQKFGSEPQASRLSKTGMAPKRVSADSLRNTGSGAGSSRLKTPPRPAKPARRGFGFGRRR